MKALLSKYYEAIIYTIFGLMIILSSYTIILNIHHYQSLQTKVSVSEIDVNYKKYMNNVTKLEDNITKSLKDTDIYLSLNKVLTILKKDGVFRLVPNTKLEYHDLYQLNDYFIEELINNGWVSVISKFDTSNKYSEEINLLINNANYMNSYLIKNGLILYDDSNSHKIVDDYHLILNNYAMYSSIILDISNSIGESNE